MAAPARARVSAVRQRRPALRSFPVLAQPDLQRAEYFHGLRKLVARYTAVLMRHLSPVLESLPPPEPRGDSRRDAARDDSAEEVRKAIRAAAREVVSAVPTASIERLTDETAATVSNFGRGQLRRAFSDTLGINLEDAFTGEPGLREQVAAFTKENVALIRSIPDKYFAQVQAVVLEGVAKGKLAPEIAKAIQERTGVAESRAALIARDQVGKFNGALNAARMKSLGVKRFRWRTMRDNRVRKDHQDLDGNVYAFDAPPAEGLPGHPVNCRCYAEPLVDEVLDEEVAPPPPTPEEPRITETVTEVPVPAFVPVPVPFVLPPAPRGEIRGDGQAVAKAHPVLEKTLGATLKVEGFDTPKVAREVETLAMMPEEVLELIGPRLADIHIAAKPLSELGESLTMKSRAERGPSTYGGVTRSVDDIGGVFVKGAKGREVLVNASLSGGEQSSTALHEFAHAFDYLAYDDGKKLSADPDFMEAWRHFLSTTVHVYSGNSYFTTAEGDVGPQETFAESLALYYEHGYAAVLQAFGGGIAEYVERVYSRAAVAKRFRPRGRKKR